jgi:hypothetical protein
VGVTVELAHAAGAVVAMTATITGRAWISLKSDRRHYIHADWARLDLAAGIITAVTGVGVRSWPISEVAKVAWIDCDLDRAVA